jgi:hypothetical protein
MVYFQIYPIFAPIWRCWTKVAVFLKKGSSSHSSLPEMFAFELNGDFLRGLIDQREVAMA